MSNTEKTESGESPEEVGGRKAGGGRKKSV